MTEVWDSSPAKGSTLLLLLALADNANDQRVAWPAIETLAKKTRQTTTTVRNQLRKLEAGGLIAREERPGRSSIYRVLTPPESLTPSANAPLSFHDANPSRETSVPLLRDDPDPSCGAGGEPSGTVKEPSEEPSTRAREELFDEFWSVYPVKMGKPKAREAFVRALRRGTFEEILAGAQRYRDDPNRDDRYTKWPQGWLNDDRWEDGALPARDQPKPTKLDATRSLLEMGRRMHAGQTQLEVEA
jgi:hypothetical protein